jgi:hypothetical protein
MAYVFYPLLLLGAEDDAHPPFGAPPASAEAMDELYKAPPRSSRSAFIAFTRFGAGTTQGRHQKPGEDSDALPRERYIDATPPAAA